MLTTYAAALCFVLAAVLAGQGVAALTDRRLGWSVAPAAGLAALLCLSALASRLPERTLAVALLPALGLIGAVALVVLRRPAWTPLPALCAGGLTLLITIVPFYVSGRSGLLGVSLNNDTSIHLVWAEVLRSDRMAALYSLPPAYPLAPHALMAGLAEFSGIAMDEVLNGLLIATAALTAIAAWPLLVRLPTAARIAGALLVAFAYLPAAYFAQGAFKETIMALFVVAFTAVLVEADGARRPWLEVGVPAGLLATGGAQVYSYLALGWFVSIAIVWLGLQLALGGRRDVRGRLHGAWKTAGPTVAAAVIVVLGGLASQADRVATFARQLAVSPADAEVGIPVTNLGNLVGKLSPYEALGVWPNPDFRFPPADAFQAGELGAVALVLVAIGVAAALRRREAGLVAAGTATLAIFWISNRTQSPYVAAKALMLAAPVLTALALGAWPSERRRWTEDALVRIALVGVFAAGAAYSSLLVLRAAPVASEAQRSDLGTFRQIVGREPTLFLGADDEHVAWWLRGVRLGALTPTLQLPIKVPLRPEKPAISGQPFDFDNVDEKTLDRFAYVITPRSGYDSEPPPNVTRVRSGRLYELWRRRGATPPRETLEPGGAPGAVLGCGRSRGRAVSRSEGSARIWAAPRLVGFSGAVRVPPGASTDFAIPLEPGRWMLSLQYTSTSPVRVVSLDASWSLPAHTGRLAPYFTLGQVDVTASGPLGIRLIAEQSARLGSRSLGARISGLVATRVNGTRDLPLRRSCGRYVDWYRAG